MDFSDAERLGFILAFSDFWMELGDGRSEDELKTAAKAVLKGCREHFCAGVTRLSKVSKVISPEKSETFRRRALSLMDLTSSEVFLEEATKLERDFEGIGPWIEWWMRPDHAAMLFASERTMEAELWDMLPETTNAEEAMHFRFYTAVGTHHKFMDGLGKLWKIADTFTRLLNAVRGMSLTTSNFNILIFCPRWNANTSWKERTMARTHSN